MGSYYSFLLVLFVYHKTTFLFFVYHQSVNLLSEKIQPRKNLPDLLLRLEQRPAERLDYLGVSYGLTSDLFR